MTLTVGGRVVPTYPDLDGKVAVVTGATKGIGAATCRMLAANGVKVAVNARTEDAVAAMVSELEATGTAAVGVAGDCTSRADTERLRAAAEDALGPVDVLLPFAGGFSSFTAIDEIEEDEWRAVIDTNLTATYLAVAEFLPGMKERRAGAIVTMSSNGGRLLDKLLTASYAAAKAGVVQFTRHVAMEMGPYGVRVNAIAPATVTSERIQAIMDDEAMARTVRLSPLGSIGTPEDCALATLFLVSDSAAWLTGITLDVAGGRVMI